MRLRAIRRISAQRATLPTPTTRGRKPKAPAAAGGKPATGTPKARGKTPAK
jgi:hypothetical protein